MPTLHSDDTPHKDNTSTRKLHVKSDSPKEEKSDKSGRHHARNVDFAMDYFVANDPAESKLITDLEENTALPPPQKPPMGHRRGASRKLHHFVKQMNRKGHSRQKSSTMSSGSYGSHDNNDLFRMASTTEVPPTEPVYNSLNHHQLQDVNEDSAVSNSNTPLLPSRSRLNSRDSSSRRASAARRRSSSIKELQPVASEFLANLANDLDEDSHGFGDFFHNGAAGSRRKESHGSKNEDPLLTSPTHTGHHRRQRTTTDALYDHAMHLERLFATEPNNNYGEKEWLLDNPSKQQGGEEQQAEPGSPTLSDITRGDDDEEGGDPERGADVRRSLLGRRHNIQPPNRLKAALWEFVNILGPWDILDGICYFLLYRVLLMVVPLLSLSAILFYWFQNPNFDFIPTDDARLSWALIFAARLVLTFSLAEATQYTLEVFTTRTTISVRVAGPLISLVAMQSLGWPCLLASWGTWTALIMRGGGDFVKNWLYFLHIGMFSTHNSDDGFLDSVIYGRILLAMVFVGVATAAKRTAVALYLSRRMLQYYRKQLGDLLADMKLVMEVAELAEATENEEFSRLMEEETKFHNSFRTSNTGNESAASTAPLTSLKRGQSAAKMVPTLSPSSPSLENLLIREFSTDEDDDEDSGSLLLSDHEPTQRFSRGSSPISIRSVQHVTKMTSHVSGAASVATSTSAKVPIQWNELKNQAKPKRRVQMERTMSPIELATSAGEIQRTHRQKQSSRGIDTMATHLDHWEEPETKGEKKALPSLHDILQFRKAMDFLENPYPFSVAFGPARTRRECIKSSVRCYRRLLRFVPGESVLDFNVIGDLLAYDENNNPLEKKALALVNLFLPEKDNVIHQLEFVRSVDAVYKSLRFLRASIINSTKIDTVLENVFDMVFNGILAIIVMTLLGLNPWPLLVSFSTVMVSFAFSFGPSCAKYIEGMLMIAIRRPYDIGDRITIISGESLTQPTPDDTWLVEDISLSTTTLRFSASNEISTINNAAIANSRIVNGARSTKAIVTIAIKFGLRTTHEQIDIFRDRVEFFLKDRPEIWDGLVHFRNDAVDHNAAYVQYLLRVQHKKSWQDMPPIMVHKGELDRYCTKVAVDLNIAWLSSHHRIRVVEVPPIQYAKDDDGGVDGKVIGTGKGEEPFMKFIKAEVG
ncbi:expressed unknown protein [Seminavis robusta]|uniref:Mechanosensitive ion channel MscS domain-containing protein n=1 Tax=Seminavis robusta TaxID=568900 RepID=A0A9N8EID9_9STRA|nr:expressed unknown protein [Seminavis robusta]|eukprot:Sro1128_g244300.1 n/a (1153) ;mRNA; f:23153-27021